MFLLAYFLTYVQVKLCDPSLSALKWFVYHARRYTSARLYLYLLPVVPFRATAGVSDLTTRAHTPRRRARAAADSPRLAVAPPRVVEGDFSLP